MLDFWLEISSSHDSTTPTTSDFSTSTPLSSSHDSPTSLSSSPPSSSSSSSDIFTPLSSPVHLRCKDETIRDPPSESSWSETVSATSIDLCRVFSASHLSSSDSQMSSVFGADREEERNEDNNNNRHGLSRLWELRRTKSETKVVSSKTDRMNGEKEKNENSSIWVKMENAKSPFLDVVALAASSMNDEFEEKIEKKEETDEEKDEEERRKEEEMERSREVEKGVSEPKNDEEEEEKEKMKEENNRQGKKEEERMRMMGTGTVRSALSSSVSMSSTLPSSSSSFSSSSSSISTDSVFARQDKIRAAAAAAAAPADYLGEEWVSKVKKKWERDGEEEQQQEVDGEEEEDLNYSGKDAERDGLSGGEDGREESSGGEESKGEAKLNQNEKCSNVTSSSCTSSSSTSKVTSFPVSASSMFTTNASLTKNGAMKGVRGKTEGEGGGKEKEDGKEEEEEEIDSNRNTEEAGGCRDVSYSQKQTALIQALLCYRKVLLDQLQQSEHHLLRLFSGQDVDLQLSDFWNSSGSASTAGCPSNSGEAAITAFSEILHQLQENTSTPIPPAFTQSEAASVEPSGSSLSVALGLNNNISHQLRAVPSPPPFPPPPCSISPLIPSHHHLHPNLLTLPLSMISNSHHPCQPPPPPLPPPPLAPTQSLSPQLMQAVPFRPPPQIMQDEIPMSSAVDSPHSASSDLSKVSILSPQAAQSVLTTTAASTANVSDVSPWLGPPPGFDVEVGSEVGQLAEILRSLSAEFSRSSCCSSPSNLHKNSVASDDFVSTTGVLGSSPDITPPFHSKSFPTSSFEFEDLSDVYFSKNDPQNINYYNSLTLPGVSGADVDTGEFQCELHLLGRCKPCAFFYNEKKGCRNGTNCEFCHHEDHATMTAKQWKKAQRNVTPQCFLGGSLPSSAVPPIEKFGSFTFSSNAAPPMQTSPHCLFSERNTNVMEMIGGGGGGGGGGSGSGLGGHDDIKTKEEN